MERKKVNDINKEERISNDHKMLQASIGQADRQTDRQTDRQKHSQNDR